MDYDFRGLKCVRRISKKVLIEENGGRYVSEIEVAKNQALDNNSAAADWQS